MSAQRSGIPTLEQLIVVVISYTLTPHRQPALARAAHAAAAAAMSAAMGTTTVSAAADAVTAAAASVARCYAVLQNDAGWHDGSALMCAREAVHQLPGS